MTENLEPITVSTTIKATQEDVWECLTLPEHITKWCKASEDWHAPFAENDMRVGGKFKTRMEALDGSTGFDFTGTYTEVTLGERYGYTMDGDDKRTVIATLEDTPLGVVVTQTFDPETENPLEMQRGGWQSILDNFKAYVESK